MTAQTSKPLEAEDAFVRALSELARGELAELRRSLSVRTGQSYRLERLIYEHLPEWYRGGWAHDAVFLVAGLYALVERPQDGDHAHEAPERDPKAVRNLGHDLGHLYRAQDERPSTEKRFLALLDADEAQLAEHLRHAVTLLNAGDIQPDWARLLGDISGWHDANRRDHTRERWAKAFYRPEPKTEPVSAQEAHP